MITAHEDCFLFSNKSNTFKIPYADILHIEQGENKLWISKTDRTQEQIVIPGRIRDISDNLDARFYLCHSYLIINLTRVVSMSKYIITFDNGETKPMGRDAYVRTRKAFLKQSREGF